MLLDFNTIPFKARVAHVHHADGCNAESKQLVASQSSDNRQARQARCRWASSTPLQPARTLLKGLFKGAADGHDLPHTLHGRAQHLINSGELGQVPARDLEGQGDRVRCMLASLYAVRIWGTHLDNAVVQARLEAGSRLLGDGIAQFRQGVTQSQLGSYVCQRVAGGLVGKASEWLLAQRSAKERKGDEGR